jgi:hypothetical protein
LANILKENNLDVIGYKHDIDTREIRHAFNKHGEYGTKLAKNSIPITDNDIKNIPYIIENYDYIELGRKSAQGLDSIRYIKTMDNGTTYYVEEVRNKNKLLTMKTMWKVRASQDKLLKLQTSSSEKSQGAASPNGSRIIPNPNLKVKQNQPSTSNFQQPSTASKANIQPNNDNAQTFYQNNPEIERGIEEVIKLSEENGTFKDKFAWGKVKDYFLIEQANKNNLNIDENYEHDIDASAIKHIHKRHGSQDKEAKRGQIAIDDNDIKAIPYIVNNYDYLIFGAKNKQDRDAIIYAKNLDGTTVYVEEVRTGKKTLSANTMWKFKNAISPKSLSANIGEHLQTANSDSLKIIPNPNLKVNKIPPTVQPHNI